MTQTRLLPVKSIFSLLKKSNSNLSGDQKIDSRIKFLSNADCNHKHWNGIDNDYA